jgi:alginate O-acetyltransferase complex protein AlgI
MGLSLVSLGFFGFFAFVFVAYWLTRSGQAQRWILLAASYVFYSFVDYRFSLLLLAASMLAYGLGRALGQTTQTRTRRLLLVGGLVANLLVLGLFKYFDFFALAIVRLLTLLGFGVETVTLHLVLPIGISFYLFKILSYLVDSYRSNSAVSSSLLGFLVYVAFFPQLLSGPIDRAGTFMSQLCEGRTFDYSLAVEGTRQVLWGLFKKLALADGLAVLVNQTMDGYTKLQGPVLALSAILFSFQIYCDFSGYADISIGLSKLLGIRPMRNFAYPYFSQNVAEFWRRWNISVSSWFRDYLYIPLGGSHVRAPRLLLNIVVTFVLSGLWHGANTTFLVWGGMLGIGVAVTAVRRAPVLKAVDTPGGKRLNVVAAGKMLVTFGFVSLSWVFFRSTSMAQALGILRRIFTPSLNSDAWLAALRELNGSRVLVLALGVFIAVEWLQRRHDCPLELGVRSRLLRWSVYTATLWLALLLLKPDLPGYFLYFRF